MEYKPTILMLRRGYNACGELIDMWIVEDCTDGNPLGKPMAFSNLENALRWIREATA